MKKRYSKKENVIIIFFEMPVNAVIIFHFIGFLKRNLLPEDE